MTRKISQNRVGGVVIWLFQTKITLNGEKQGMAILTGLKKGGCFIVKLRDNYGEEIYCSETTESL